MTPDFQIPELTTPRLRMRLPKATDIPAHAAFHASARSKNVGGPMDAAASYAHLAGIVGQWQLRGYGRWMVADRETDEPLGVVGLYHPMDWPEAEVGWTLYEQAEGKGIAREAATATIRHAYIALGWKRIVSLVANNNLRSVQLAQALGCRKESVYEHPTFGLLDVWVHRPPEAWFPNGEAPQ